MARKHATFDQLYTYINSKARDEQFIIRNLFVGDPNNKKKIVSDFIKNSNLLFKRKNGNILYHEIISIKKDMKISLEKQKDILQDIAEKFLDERAQNLIVFGRIHIEAHHLHYHLMLSSNECGKKKRYRLAKVEFSKIQKNVEQYLQQTYPEFQQQVVYTKKTPLEKVKSDKEYQVKKRKSVTKKEKLITTLETIFTQSKSKQDFLEAFKHYNLSIYQRGKHTVIQDGERKHRLKTLGLESAYHKMQERVARLQQRAQEIKDIRKIQDSIEEHERDRASEETVKEQNFKAKLSQEQERRKSQLEELRLAQDKRKLEKSQDFESDM